ncbi:hypothetical protein ALC56_07519, partial [Trachymyrmex septentrionalis]
ITFMLGTGSGPNIIKKNFVPIDYAKGYLDIFPCSSQKSLQVSYAVSLLIVQNSKSFMELVFLIKLYKTIIESVEKLLDFVVLRNTTGLDIFLTVEKTLKKFIIHYIIHQEALADKVVKLSTFMETITKIINEIKGGHKFLTHRKFKLFFDKHKAVYTDVPFHFFSSCQILLEEHDNNCNFKEYIYLKESLYPNL